MTGADHAVVVIGGGQAGLAASRELRELDVEHTVLERGRAGQTWRDRWDSFCLVTPNWFVQLPGQAYDGDEPDGFMPRDEIVAYLERYASDAPLQEGVEVHALERDRHGWFVVHTSSGDLQARAVVVATGAYQRPHRPAAAATLPDDVAQLDADDYRTEDALPPGRVLVVGSGQTGCQITEELHEAGRDVVLACGRTPWAPRRIGDHDLVWWVLETGFLDGRVESLPAPAARLAANVVTTGRAGGHDLHLRTLQQAGVTLTGRFLGANGREARFAPDLGESLAWGDERYADLMRLVRGLVSERGLDEPALPDPEPFDARAPERVDLRDVGCVLFTSGFRPDYGSWLSWPQAFDELGFPVHEDGESTEVPGLFFLGVHFLRKRKSSLLGGVGEDAAIVARRVAARIA